MTDKPTPTTDLLKRCAEIYEWRSTGVLSGEALRDYAKRKWPDLHDTLQMAEHETVTEALALLAKWGQPAPATQQAAPKTAPGVGNSGFDHQTAADFLNGKTVSDEAVRNFVATSRWAHDERAALSATLLAMHGVLTSREAEIALLKKALLEAEAAPQQEAQEPVAWESTTPGYIKYITQARSAVRRWYKPYRCSGCAERGACDMAAPQSEQEAFEAWIEKDGGDLGTFGTPPNMHYRNSAVNNAWVAWKARAALAAQGGK